MNQSALFWDKIAVRYSERPVADETAYQKKLRITRDYFRPDMAVLEFGCGTGSTAIVHAPYVKHVHAIDISSKMIAIAQDKANAANIKNVTFEQATIEEFIPEKAFDAVLGLSVLHLLDDKAAAIAKIHRTLKPGGIFVTSTPCLGDTMKFFKLIGPIGAFLGLIPKVAVFTTKELQNHLTAAGFKIDYQWRPAKGKALFIVAKKMG